ncbi:WD40 repeat [Geodermatophilus aquaeductus]|uniref:WD40 repeat n=2 Tax=Geodermatophilus aquaeductus TaxID=1564161 RepID=A0A521F864_9ACTN|nr:WD40 repeat [Geodermatophilus aquaeductus]
MRQPTWDRPGVAAARDEIISLFTSRFGYTHLTGLGLNPTQYQLTEQLRALCRQQVQPEDHLVVYFSGHGEVLDASGEHVLLTSDTDPDDIDNALRTAELARKLLLGTPVQRLLLLLDTCYSGKGGNELAASALEGMQRDWGSGGGLVVVTSALPAEQAEAAAFPALLREAVDSLATAGHAPTALDIGAVVAAMNDSENRPSFQRIGWTGVGLTGHAPEFLPNPRHRAELTDLDLYLQDVTAWDNQSARRDTEYRRRFLLRAMGSPTVGPPTWWFSGRRAALSDIADWLHDHPADRPGLAVTGGPGTGKTAVLGLVATLSDPDYRRAVPLDELDLAISADRFHGVLDVAIYAGALTTDQVLAGLAAAAKVRAGTVAELVDRLADWSGPLVALIDALDEAADPQHLITHLLAPLLNRSKGRVRLLLGTRPHLLPLLGSAVQTVGLDEKEYADWEAIRAYTMRGLLEGAEYSPYLDAHPLLVRDVASAVTAAAMPSFLVARIVSTTLAAEPQVADITDRAWRAGLPRLPGEAMRADLDRRLGANAQRARDLLRPLAYAHGQGLPWENLWAPLASAISGHTYADEDLLWLRRAAGSYVVEATEAGRSAYRLYHEALAEHLRQDTDPATVESAFVDTLRRRVPSRVGGGRDWRRAHPYTLMYLATHAAAAGRIDDLVGDTEYLVHADPDILATAIRTATTPVGRLVRTMYLASVGVHGTADAATRRDILAIDAARCAATDQLTTLVEDSRFPVRWATGAMVHDSLRATLTGHQGSIRTVACTKLNSMSVAVTGGNDGAVRIWNLATGTEHATLAGHQGSVSALACAELDGTPVAVTGGSDGTVRLWGLAAGTESAVLTCHEGPVTAVACAQLDGTLVAVTGGEDGTVRLWDLATGISRPVLPGHKGGVNAVACTELDGTPVAVTGGEDESVRLWDLASGTERAVLTGHKGRVYAVACTLLDGTPVAVTGGEDDSVRLWDLASGTERAVLTGHDDWVNAVACTLLDGTPVAITGGDDDTVRLWDLASGTERAVLTGHDNLVRAVACTLLDGTPVAITGDNSGTVRLWELPTGTEQVALTGHKGGVSAVACTELDGTPVAVTAGDNTVRLWDLTTGTERAVLSHHEGWVSTVACTLLDGTPVAVTAGGDSKVRLWNLATGTERAVLTGHKAPPSAVACTELDGTPVAVTAGDGTVRLWDLATGAERAVLGSHEGWVTAVACAGFDRTAVAVAVSRDGTLWVWDLATGTEQAMLAGHEGGLSAVACAQLDGTPVAVTGSFDGTVRLWDLASATERGVLTGHEGWVTAVVCTELDGTPVAITGSVDRTVRVWDLTAEQLVGVHALPYPATHLSATQSGDIVVSANRELIGFAFCLCSAVADYPSDGWRSGHADGCRLADGRFVSPDAAANGGQDSKHQTGTSWRTGW